jgi:RNase adaptor protein for sRNA GlmZ degradation
MQLFLLQQHGFRVTACADETHVCWVEFYPNSPHYTWEIEEVTQLESKFKDWERINSEIPKLEDFSNWKQQVENRIDDLSWQEQSDEVIAEIPERWDLISQTLFLAGLSVNEAEDSLA